VSDVLNSSSVARVRAALGALLVMSSGAKRVDPLRASVEQSLSAHKDLWAAAGHPHTVFRLTYEELLRITQGIAIQVAKG
jgi:hypothetical protein